MIRQPPDYKSGATTNCATEAKNAELLTEMTGTQQGEKVFNLQAYYYATYCTLTIQSWQHPLAHWNSFVLVGFSKGKRIIF